MRPKDTVQNGVLSLSGSNNSNERKLACPKPVEGINHFKAGRTGNMGPDSGPDCSTDLEDFERW